MASQKLSALPNLAGGQVPSDLAYVVDVSAGPAGSMRSTLNDLFAIVTKNITDGALRFQGFAAPAVSGAGEGAIYFDSTANAFRISENAGAYRAIGDVTGPTGATDEALARFDGATGKIIQNSLITLSDAGALTFPDNVRQTFNPGVTNAGLNVGAVAGDPSAPVNGDLWYDSAANTLRARINGASISLGANTPGGSNTQVQYNNAGAFGGVTGFTSDGTNVTAGSNNLRATSPRVITSINDANGAELFGLTATASAVNEFTVANAATGNAPTLSATGDDTNINITITPKGTGILESTGPLRLSGSGVDQFTTPIGNSIPTKINIPLFDPGSFGQILALGLASGIAASARVITVCDQRAAGHQPSIAVLSPDESQIFGLSWDGQNSIGYLINTSGVLGVQGRFVQESGGVALATLDNTANAYFGNGITNATPADYILNATGGSGSNIAGANLDLAGGKGTGNATPGMVAVRYPLIGASGTTLQSLSADRFPVGVCMYTVTSGSNIANTTAETSIFVGTTAPTPSAGSTRQFEAGSTRAGTFARLRAHGTISVTGTPTLTLRLKLGTTTIATTSAITINTSGCFSLEADINLNAFSAAAGVNGIIKFQAGANPGAITITQIALGTAIVDLTADQDFELTVQWSAASPSNSFAPFAITLYRDR